MAPTKDLLPGELKPFTRFKSDCKAILEGKIDERLTKIIVFNEKALLFCKGTNGFTINEILFRNKPFITSDKDPGGFWTIYISASPRHFQLEAISQDDAAEFTLFFEAAVNDYLRQKPAEEDDVNEEALSTRKTQEKEGQNLLDDLTRKWKKDGPLKKTGLEWLPSSGTIYKILIFLIIIGTAHSTFILFTSSYSLSVDKQALMDLAKKNDTWANKQLVLNLGHETDNTRIMKSLNIIEGNINENTANILLSQLENVSLPKAKKKILTILINSGMAGLIENAFLAPDSKGMQKEIIELTGEIDSPAATFLLHRIYAQRSNDLRAILLMVLARKGDMDFLFESYRNGSSVDRSNCIEAAMSLPENLKEEILKNFLQIEKNSTTVTRINQLLGGQAISNDQSNR